MSIELFECTPLSARISRAQCSLNRKRGTFACGECSGLGGGSVVDPYSCPHCRAVLSTAEAAGELCPVCKRRLSAAAAPAVSVAIGTVAVPASPAPSPVVDDSPVVSLLFSDPEDRAVYEALLALPRSPGQSVADDILAVLHWFVLDFSLGEAADVPHHG